MEYLFTCYDFCHDIFFGLGSSEVNIIPSLASRVKLYFFSSSLVCKHRGHRKFVRCVLIIRKVVPKSRPCTNRMNFIKHIVWLCRCCYVQVLVPTVNNSSVVLWFLMQFIHWWVEYCGLLEANSSMTSRFWVALIYSKIRRALSIGRWFMLNLYLWLWRTGLALCKVLTVLVQRQWLKDHNFWLQWCSVAADIVYNFEGLSRNDSRPFFYVQPVSTFHCQWIITHRVHCFTNINSNN